MKLKRIAMGLIMALIYLLTICINVSAYGEISKKADLTISNLKELVAFRDSVNKGNTYKGKTVKLLKDIDMSSIDNWEPIGKNDKPFTGTFDGRNKTISNLIITDSENACGLFGIACTDNNGATIKNLNLINIKITCKSSKGAIVGTISHGSLINCHASGNISNSSSRVGGLIGFGEYNKINKCSSSVNITSNENAFIGGLIGDGYYSTITNCTVDKNVTINGRQYVGGIIGYAVYTKISNCKSSASISGYDDVGGFVGHLSDHSNINNSNSDGNVTGTNDTGGLVGYQSYGSKITDCYSTGNVNGTGNVGGLVGYSWHASSYNCYATGNVNGTGSVGGLVGSSNSDNIVHCHTHNDVIGKLSIGGLVGGSGSSKIINCNSASNALGEYYIGGIVGNSGNDIFINCYSNGNVSLKRINNNSTYFDDFGGFAGYLGVEDKVINCYSSGTISGEKYVGGFSGDISNNANYINNYFNSDSIQNAFGYQNENISTLPTGKSLTSMKNQSFAFELNGSIPEDIAKILKENNITVYKYNWKYGENNNLPFIDSTLPY